MLSITQLHITYVTLGVASYSALFPVSVEKDLQSSTILTYCEFQQLQLHSITPNTTGTVYAPMRLDDTTNSIHTASCCANHTAVLCILSVCRCTADIPHHRKFLKIKAYPYCSSSHTCPLYNNTYVLHSQL